MDNNDPTARITRQHAEEAHRQILEDTPLPGDGAVFPVTLHLNARFQPMHRHELEDALETALDRLGLGSVDGGGTLTAPSGEVQSCDIELFLRRDVPQAVQRLAELAERMGIAKGSRLLYENAAGEREERPVGTLEGMAIYLNGTELPAAVYQECDINYVIGQLSDRLEGLGGLYSWWEGPRETALYFYGGSYPAMAEAVRDFLETYPLCQKCRLEQIA